MPGLLYANLSSEKVDLAPSSDVAEGAGIDGRAARGADLPITLDRLAADRAGHPQVLAAVGAESEARAPGFSTASELIAAVNALRAARGLPAYQPNPILMGLSQPVKQDREKSMRMREYCPLSS